jgi:tetratricopeptide (TPR) repeat protein
MHCVTAHPSRDPASELLRRAEQAYLLHESNAVIDACNAMRISSSPALRAEAALLEAKLRFDLEQRDRAIALLSDAHAIAPNDARPTAGLARIAITTGNREQSVQLAEMALRLEPLEFSVPCSLALAYANEQHERSQLAWAAANALAPDDAIVAEIAYAAAFVEGKYAEGLAFVERLSQYQGTMTRVADYAALGFLVTAARREYLSVAALAESLGIVQHNGPLVTATRP